MIRRISAAVVAWLPAVAWLLVACSGPNAAATQAAITLPPGMRLNCGDVPEPRCTGLAVTYPSVLDDAVTELTMRCSSQVCTESDGRVDIGLLTETGLRVATPDTWGSPTVPADVPPGGVDVPPVCLGVPDAQCAEMGSAARPVGAPPVSRIVVTCSTACTPASGEGQTRVHFVDGTRMLSSWGYGR